MDPAETTDTTDVATVAVECSWCHQPIIAGRPLAIRADPDTGFYIAYHHACWAIRLPGAHWN